VIIFWIFTIFVGGVDAHTLKTLLAICIALSTLLGTVASVVCLALHNRAAAAAAVAAAGIPAAFALLQVPITALCA